MINQAFVTWGEGGAGVRGRQELLVTRQEFFPKKALLHTSNIFTFAD